MSSPPDVSTTAPTFQYSYFDNRYNNLNYNYSDNLLSYDLCYSGPTYDAPELPLHAPAPLPGQPSSLLFSSYFNKSEQYLDSLPLSIPHSPSESNNPYPSTEPSATRHPQATFPTPSAMLTQLATSANPPPLQQTFDKTESVRKARRRAMAQSIGFVPTDPCATTFATHPSLLTASPSDVISSHEKKRHYLECLEYYVLYLHQQLSLVGCVPVRLQRPTSSSTRGMSSQSIRTLLVHMENLTRRLNQEMLVEEQRYMRLRSLAEQISESQ